MTTTTYMPPALVDIVDKLPHANLGNEQWKSVAGTRILAIHYTDETVHPGYNELAYMIGEARYHIQKDWNPPHHVYGFGIMYHYMISYTGVLYRTQPENLLTWNATNANGIDIACCLHLGQGQQPSQAQLNTLQAYLDWMCFHRPDFPAGQKDVWGHGELVQYGNSTDCPGLVLPHVQNYRKTGHV